jgi:hypothetical protein
MTYGFITEVLDGFITGLKIKRKLSCAVNLAEYYNLNLYYYFT